MTRMVSPCSKRGKGIGALIGRWCLRCLAIAGPWTVWRPTGYHRTCRGRSCITCISISVLWAFVTSCASLVRRHEADRRVMDGPLQRRCDKPALRPYSPLGGWHPWAATDLPAHPIARGGKGPKGEGGGLPSSTTHRHGAAGPEIPFGPACRLKISIDKLRRRAPAARAIHGSQRRPQQGSTSFAANVRGCRWAIPALCQSAGPANKMRLPSGSSTMKFLAPHGSFLSV
jgi:hypothetical protein